MRSSLDILQITSSFRIFVAHPRVTLSVESDVPFEGFSPYVVIKGIARVEEGGAVAVLRRITNGQFPPPGDDWPEGFVLHISPQRLSGVGPWGLAK